MRFNLEVCCNASKHTALVVEYIMLVCLTQLRAQLHPCETDDLPHIPMIIRGTLLYKWKRDFYPESLYFFWTVRHSELGSFQWFVSLITKLMTKHEMNKQAGNIGAKNNVQIHIYVTSYNAKANEQRRVQTLKDRGSSKILRASRMAAANANIGTSTSPSLHRLPM